MEKIWITSDSHLNHRRIIEYCSRPFTNVEEMNEHIIAQWNKKVGKNDKVIHLGDFALCGKDKIIEIGNRLKGRKILIKGNHDGASRATYYEAGFEEVYSFPIVVNDFIILSHMPQFTQPNGLYANIFGHVHTDEKYKTVTARSLCACVERWDYGPILLEDAIKMMKECEDNEGQDD